MSLDTHSRLRRAAVPGSKLRLFYLLMLLAHAAHVIEEIWGRFWLIDSVLGLGPYLLASEFLFCLPVVFFYHVRRDQRWAYDASMAYAGLMTLNGLGHHVALLVTGRYYGGWAGAVSGLALLVIGPLLAVELWRARPRK